MKRIFTYLRLIASGLLFLNGGWLNAQSPELNEEKYWEYRERLKQEYMIGIGPGMGMSTPAGVRDTVSGILQWTDATMDLGQYIAILAMEYRIMEEKGRDVEETIRELFYALHALNRLDYNAEGFFGGTRSLNGFFMRDEIDMDSLDMTAVLEHLNQGLPEYKITTLDSDYMDQNPRNNEESLDQAILLITGLGMVCRCVPEDVVYEEDDNILEFQDFETSLNLEARHIITRIVNYMKEGDSTTVQLDPGDTNLYGIQGEAWDFIIKNAVTYESVMRGENAFLTSKGFTSAKFHFTGLLSPTTNGEMDTIADTLFKSYETHIIPNDQDFKVINLNAMSNYWPDGLQGDSTNTEYNAKILGPRSQGQGYEWIPMLHQLVFGGEQNYLMSEVPPDTLFYDDPWGFYEYLLNEAPMNGPYNYGDSIWPNWEWSSTSRTIQPGRRGETANAFPGNYNGLDYMLYYNMYTILYPGPVKIEDLIHVDLKVYPNPFIDRLYVDIVASADYCIYDMNGKEILRGNLPGKGSIATGDLEPGLYIMIIIDNYGNIQTQKVVKQSFK